MTNGQPRYEIKLYKKIKPNVNGHLHYVFNDVNKYLAKLEPYAVLSLDPSKYSMFEGQLVLNDTEPINYKEVTYMSFLEYNEDGKSIDAQFFIVNSAAHYSDKYMFEIVIDIFANYINTLKIKSMFINKCNRLLPTLKGYEEEVEGTYFDGNRTALEGNGKIKLEDVYIILIVNHVTFQNSWTKEYETITEPLAINMKELIDEFKKIYGNDIATKSEIFTIVNQLISNMYYEENETRFDIKILKCYIIPNEFLRLDVNGTLFFKTAKSHMNREKVKIITFNTYLIQVSDIKKEFILDKNIFIGTKNYIGPFNNGLKVVNPVCESMQFYIEVEMSYTAAKIIIGQGDNIKDITNSFEFRPTGNSNELDANQKIGMAIGDLVGFFKDTISIGTDIASGNYAGAAAGGLGMIGDVANRLGNRGQASGQDGLTDAYLTYTQNNSFICTQDELQYPFYNHAYISKFNTLLKLRMNGANYNEFARDNDLNFENYAFAGLDQANIDLSNHTFLKASIVFDNGQEEVCNYIKAKFENGIYYEFLY